MEHPIQYDQHSLLKDAEAVFLDEKAVGQQLNIPVATLQRWRWLNTGPKFHKFGRLVRYSQSDIEAFIQTARM